MPSRARLFVGILRWTLAGGGFQAIQRYFCACMRYVYVKAEANLEAHPYLVRACSWPWAGGPVADVCHVALACVCVSA